MLKKTHLYYLCVCGQNESINIIVINAEFDLKIQTKTPAQCDHRKEKCFYNSGGTLTLAKKFPN